MRRMARMKHLLVLALGAGAGLLSGMFGIGGGILIVPILIYGLNLSPHEAVGTSLAALLLPVGLLGALQYYRDGYVHLGYAALLAAGLFVGAYWGARLSISLQGTTLERLFGGVLIAAGLWMILRR
ncbi:MAG: sulfite exporter TauE/SafE family protein [Blastocatellia bacterium]|nr:sulfite exporter TauE/SafE family protein [Blastocatellia bacterium]MCS7157291.1 sulfite exporter TauE/SafE family protein [Blastocatellia bacterium]MCX7752032.1 sulfite exporter TauE/SafE family protein [Blastocatellia bacterium]